MSNKETPTEKPAAGSALGFVSKTSVLSDPASLAQARFDVAAASARSASTSLVEYRSEGRCLLVAAGVGTEDVDHALACAQSLDGLKCTVLCPLPDASSDLAGRRDLTEDGVAVLYRHIDRVRGHLGQFDVQVTSLRDPEQSEMLGVVCMTESGFFDLLLDLREEPLFSQRLPPFGYYHAADSEAIEVAMVELPALVGEFEKPKYFEYDPGICAHSRSQLSGCSNCQQVCATAAISSAGDGIRVDPFLCQGCGHCATVCPSGAMVYAYPNPASAIETSRSLITLRAKPTTGLLLYPSPDSDDSEQVASVLERHLPDAVVAVAVEESGAFGIDYWASMIAAGIRKVVVLLRPPQFGRDTESDSESEGNPVLASLDSTVDGASAGPKDIRSDGDKAIEEQAALLGILLSGLGLPANCVEVIADSDQLFQPPQGTATGLWDLPESSGYVTDMKPAAFATHNDKRATVRAAIDHLQDAVFAAAGSGDSTGQSSSAANPPMVIPEAVDLPAGSLFGRLEINTDACTLCMACVSTCPAGALNDGHSLPQLKFIEANCVQCGLCTAACPENALQLQPRYLYDTALARKPLVINEEEPFNCIRCHTPFATRKLIDTMTEKLSAHWMFEQPESLRRLRMCEDCRVKDMFENHEEGIKVHREPGETERTLDS